MRNAETVLGVIRERGRRAGVRRWQSARSARRKFIANEPRGTSLRHRSLESDVTRKLSRIVRRGAVGKLPAKVTRWRPTLRQVKRLSGDDTVGQAKFVASLFRIAA